MATKLKVIKSKDFTANETSQTHYTCAYKGRVFGVSTLRFEPDDITVENGVLTINGDIEVLKSVSTDPLTGETRIFLDIVPKSGMVLAEF